eukprot:COSAG06_NODE_29781_length_550_cov_1.235033_1_plen_133_part_10
MPLLLAAAALCLSRALADPPICVAPTTCEEVIIGAFMDEGLDLSAVRLAVDDVNADANILPRTHLSLRELSLAPVRAAAESEDGDALRVAAADAVRALADTGAVAALGGKFSSDVFALEAELAEAAIPLMGYA